MTQSVSATPTIPSMPKVSQPAPSDHNPGVAGQAPGVTQTPNSVEVPKVAADVNLADIPAGITQHVLDNGVRLVLDSRPGALTTTYAVGVAAGAVQEAKAGTAHLFEHLAFQQTPTRPGNQIEKDIAVLGDANAYTDFTRILYHITVPTQSSSEGEDLVSDIYMHPSAAPEDIKEQQGVVTQELRQRALPMYHAYEEVNRLVMGDQPLSGDQGGTVAGVTSANEADLAEYHGKYFVGNNTVALYSGDPKNMDLAKIQDTIGQLPPGEKLDKSQIFQGYRPGPMVEVVPDDSTPQVELMVTFPTQKKSDPKSPATAILATLIGGGGASIMSERLKEKDKLTTEIGTYNDSNPNYGMLMVDTNVDPKNVRKSIAAIGEELERLKSGNVTDDDISIAQRQTYNELRIKGAKPGATGMKAVETALEDQEIKTVAQQVEEIKSFTPDQIREAAKELVDWDNVKIVARGPIDKTDEIQAGLADAKVATQLEVIAYDEQRYLDRLKSLDPPADQPQVDGTTNPTATTTS